MSDRRYGWALHHTGLLGTLESSPSRAKLIRFHEHRARSSERRASSDRQSASRTQPRLLVANDRRRGAGNAAMRVLLQRRSPCV